jgi:hypothetical protein
VNSRASFTAHEIEFGKKFVMMYEQRDKHMLLDLEKLDSTEPASLPTSA